MTNKKKFIKKENDNCKVDVILCFANDSLELDTNQVLNMMNSKPNHRSTFLIDSGFEEPNTLSESYN